MWKQEHEGELVGEEKPRRHSKDPLIAGQLLPRTRILLKGNGIHLRDFFYDKRGVLFGGPGAFVPVCSDRHITGFRDRAPQLRAAGIDFIGCIYANDPYVLKAWARMKRVQDQFTFISDVEGRLTGALGLLAQERARALGIRPRRFAMVIDRGGLVEWVAVDDNCFAEDVMAHLGLSAAQVESLPDETASPWAEDEDVEENEADDDEELESGDEIAPGEDATEERLTSQEILVARWKSLIVDASIRNDDLAAKCIPLVSRGNRKDCLCINYCGRPSQHTVSHTPRCLRISVDVGRGMEGFGSVRFDDRDYVATDLHLVGPSPHTLDGASAFHRPIELRIIHQSVTTESPQPARAQLVVVAVTFNPPPLTAAERDNVVAINPFLNQVLEIPTLSHETFEVFQVGKRAMPGGGFELNQLFSDDDVFYNYHGVLSAVGEKVTWFVKRDPLSLSRIQLHALEKYLTSQTWCSEPGDCFAMAHVFRFLPKLSHVRAQSGSVIVESLRKKLYTTTTLSHIIGNSVYEGLERLDQTSMWLRTLKLVITEQEKENQDYMGLIDRALEVYSSESEEEQDLSSSIWNSELGEINCKYLLRFLYAEDARRLAMNLPDSQLSSFEASKTTRSEPPGASDAAARREAFARSTTAPGSMPKVVAGCSSHKRLSLDLAAPSTMVSVLSSSSDGSPSKPNAPTPQPVKSAPRKVPIVSSSETETSGDEDSDSTSAEETSFEEKTTSDESSTSNSKSSSTSSASPSEGDSSDSSETQTRVSKRPVSQKKAVARRDVSTSSAATTTMTDSSSDEETTSAEDKSSTESSTSSSEGSGDESASSSSEASTSSESSSSIEASPPPPIKSAMKKNHSTQPPTLKPIVKERERNKPVLKQNNVKAPRHNHDSNPCENKRKAPPTLSKPSCIPPLQTTKNDDTKKSKSTGNLKRGKQPDPKFLTEERIELVNFMLQKLKRTRDGADLADDLTVANTAANINGHALTSAERRKMEKVAQSRLNHKKKIRIRFDPLPPLESSQSASAWSTADRKTSRELRLKGRKPTGHPALGVQVANMLKDISHLRPEETESDGPSFEPPSLDARPVKGALKIRETAKAPPPVIQADTRHKAARKKPVPPPSSTSSSASVSSRGASSVQVDSSEGSSKSSSVESDDSSTSRESQSEEESDSTSEPIVKPKKTDNKQSRDSASSSSSRSKQARRHQNQPQSSSASDASKEPKTRNSAFLHKPCPPLKLYKVQSPKSRTSVPPPLKGKPLKPSPVISSAQLPSTDRETKKLRKAAETMMLKANGCGRRASDGSSNSRPPQQIFGRMRNRMASMKTPIEPFVQNVEELRVKLGIL